ncbi:MAG: chorismate synthase [Chloroflexi bacterium]|nr:chorismate synthase [Chloroflexota bacterium]
MRCGYLNNRPLAAPSPSPSPISIIEMEGSGDTFSTTPGPGHAEITGAVKYNYGELRLALERASAREAAARVAVGAICQQLLRRIWRHHWQLRHPGGQRHGRYSRRHDLTPTASPPPKATTFAARARRH